MIVGKIVGSHGLKGQLKIDPATDFLTRFHKGARLRLDGEWIEVESFQIHKGRPLIKLAGISDKTAADKLQWKTLEALDTAPDLDEDEFLVEDLIDMRVVTMDGKEIGFVDEVMAMPAHEVLRIGEILIPFVDEFVQDIDVETETITVQLIPGMLPGEETA